MLGPYAGRLRIMQQTEPRQAANKLGDDSTSFVFPKKGIAFAAKRHYVPRFAGVAIKMGKAVLGYGAGDVLA